MGFLRRILGGDPKADESSSAPPVDQTALEAEERARELELLREEQARMSELTIRQLRYAEYAWQPPDEGGERRSDDGDARTEQV